MTVAPIFRLLGTSAQNELVADALRRCSFDWSLLRPGIDAQRGAGFLIPVEWADLSRYAARTAGAHAAGGHDHGHGSGAHPLAFREQVLGLAWYSLRITLSETLVDDPDLAAEVFLAEAAHLADFTYLTNAHRVAIWNALHPGAHEDLAGDVKVVDGVPLGPTGEGWFDVGGYFEWIGEAWMGLFVRAYSDVPVQIDSFRRKPTVEGIAEIRAVIPPVPSRPPVWGTRRGWTFHRDDVSGVMHRWRREVTWVDPAAAVAAGRRPCRICRPV